MQGQGVRRLYSFMKGGSISGSPSKAGPALSDSEGKAFSSKDSSFWMEYTYVLFLQFNFTRNVLTFTKETIVRLEI